MQINRSFTKLTISLSINRRGNKHWIASSECLAHPRLERWSVDDDGGSASREYNYSAMHCATLKRGLIDPRYSHQRNPFVQCSPRIHVVFSVPIGLKAAAAGQVGH